MEPSAHRSHSAHQDQSKTITTLLRGRKSHDRDARRRPRASTSEFCRHTVDQLSCPRGRRRSWRPADRYPTFSARRRDAVPSLGPRCKLTLSGRLGLERPASLKKQKKQQDAALRWCRDHFEELSSLFPGRCGGAGGFPAWEATMPIKRDYAGSRGMRLDLNERYTGADAELKLPGVAA